MDLNILIRLKKKKDIYHTNREFRNFPLFTLRR